MRKVITVNLNGNSYQVEETGYQALGRYLDTAAAQLAGNPDAAEILADLEQAIGDKCDTFLGAHKNVVTAEEIDTVLREMGPVESTAPDAGRAQAGAGGGNAGSGGAGDSGIGSGGTANPGTGPQPGAGAARKLHRLKDGSLAGGVCSGLAAYFHTDVVWVRLLFVLLTCVTGVWLLVWLALLIIVPVAHTDADIAAAHGGPAGSAAPRRLFRLPDTGVMGGVCAGLAAYFSLDATLVRVAFVLLTLFTGVWLLVWLALLFLMPVASSPEDYAAAHGDPFNAQDVIDRAKKKAREAGATAAAAMKDGFGSMKQGFASLDQELNEGWRRHERQRRRARYRSWHRRRPVGYGAQVAAGLSLPILSALSAVLFVAFLVALFALLGGHPFLGWQLPLTPDVPRWIPVVLLLVAYGLIAAPIGAARRASHRYANGGTRTGWASAADGLLWVGLVTLLLWELFHYVPWIHELMQDNGWWFPWQHHHGPVQV